ncbi:hypothetical protein [Cryptosporangium arvum]|uniref:Uncharacterized protein n=1 Tax=Cryptosporangium arvum DSM 44712 TaxID=927661 RepID=A0A010YIC9_9ACTN|nr:hypothetical protein [Cryptosporangium arvum]EXG80020.1 hypothetical protein CryarDRAFT_1079 [Cryptosporangium arvum DSM 44712]
MTVTEQTDRTLDALLALREAIAAGSRTDRRAWVAAVSKMTGGGARTLAFYAALGRVLECVDVEYREAADT